jgi:carboxypeptidase C (cathepsin A)
MKSILFFLFAFLSYNPLFAEDTAIKKIESSVDSNKKETQEFQWTNEIQIKKTLPTESETFSYEVRIDALRIPTKEGQKYAEIYCTSYFANPLSDSRPILFCFNGGPGSSSVWLHMGLLGPKRLQFPSPITGENHKGQLSDNPNSLLRYADLVFIDPVSTGFSHSSKECDAKDYLGIDEDVSYFATFIERYLSHFHRWKSPKYLLGESYGTTRAVLLADELHSSHFFDVDGLILISLALDLNMAINANPYNELSLVAILPSLAVTAQHYGLLDKVLQKLPALELYNKAKLFAQVDLAPALLLGPTLPSEKLNEIAVQLSHLTGLPSSTISKAKLRITFKDCAEFLLQQKNIAIGTFDTRISTFIPYKEECPHLDPSLSYAVNDFTTAINAYLTQDLGLEEKHPYTILNIQSNRDWNWISFQKQGFHPLSPNATAVLEDILCKMPSLRVYTAIGLYDTATPPLSQELTLGRLVIENQGNRISSSLFEGGHMMYLDSKICETLSKEMKAFLQKK